jgi:hypothetical protein
LHNLSFWNAGILPAGFEFAFVFRAARLPALARLNGVRIWTLASEIEHSPIPQPMLNDLQCGLSDWHEWC